MSMPVFLILTRYESELRNPEIGLLYKTWRLIARSGVTTHHRSRQMFAALAQNITLP